MKRKQMANKRFGSLTALAFAGNGDNGANWECRCDCGKIKVIQGYLLRRGSVKTCGCGIGIKNDFTGKRFGKLLILNKLKAGKDRSILWNAKCECGAQITISSKSLLHGNSKSCGCLRRIEKGESNFNRIVKGYKEQAKQRGLSFSLSKEQFRELTKGNCFYCGIQPLQRANRKFSNGEYLFNGVDRLDNSKGYTPENTKPCCFICNRAKSNSSYDEFIRWIKRIKRK